MKIILGPDLVRTGSSFGLNPSASLDSKSTDNQIKNVDQTEGEENTDNNPNYDVLTGPDWFSDIEEDASYYSQNQESSNASIDEDDPGQNEPEYREDQKLFPTGFESLREKSKDLERATLDFADAVQKNTTLDKWSPEAHEFEVAIKCKVDDIRIATKFYVEASNLNWETTDCGKEFAEYTLPKFIEDIEELTRKVNELKNHSETIGENESDGFSDIITETGAALKCKLDDIINAIESNKSSVIEETEKRD